MATVRLGSRRSGYMVLLAVAGMTVVGEVLMVNVVRSVGVWFVVDVVDGIVETLYRRVVCAVVLVR